MTYNFDALLVVPPKIKIVAPLFSIDVPRRSGETCELTLRVSRMDGLPEPHTRADGLQRHRADWLTFNQTMDLLGALVCALPQYGQWRW